VAHIREIARHGLLESYTKDNTGGKSEDRVYRCIDYIHTHLADDCLSLPVLAEYVHLSPDRLSHVFRKTMGIPLQRYIIWARLKRAVQIALTNGIDLTEAAFAAGFYDSAHFSRKFKDFFGVKPSAVYNSRIVQVL
jgi:AraC-like DNA-binding protein